MIGEKTSTVRLCASGVIIGDRTLPFVSGSVHYFALARTAWQPALEALKRLGAHFVDTVVPWSVHEKARGEFDFGEDNPRLDLVHFLEVAREAGLLAVVRPGPRVFEELTFDGVPERVLWDEACQARSPSGASVIVPNLPLAYPLPSHASNAFHVEAAIWLGAVAERLGPLSYPDGPVALVHVDGQPTSPFHGGPYDHDYHPDAVAQYRRFLRQKYENVGVLRRVHRDPSASFETILPPSRLDTTDPDALAPHLDWSEFHEALLEGALYRYGKALGRHGLARLPKISGVPADRHGLSFAPTRLSRVVDAVTLECRASRSSQSRARARRSITELSSRAKTRERTPSIASAMAAGFAADASAFSDDENAFAALTALAYGVRGLNVRMAVQRDRWIGGPIDVRGRPRPSANFWTRLFQALERTRFHELERRTPVHVVIPRSLERLAGICRTLGPLAPEFVDGDVKSGSALEGDFDPSRGAILEAERFVDTLENILDRARVPYATLGADALDRALEGSLWTIVVSPGALAKAFTAKIVERVAVSGRISVGPRAPDRDDSMRLSSARLPGIEHPVVPVLLPRGPSTLAELVETTLTELGAPRLVATPDFIRTTVHHAPDGHPAALFVINETTEFTNARVALAGATSAEDALTGERFSPTGEHVDLPVPPRSARFLELARPK